VDTSVVPAHQWHAERKEKFTLFSDHNGSLLKAAFYSCGMLMKQQWAARVMLDAPKHHTLEKKEKIRLRLSASI